MFFFLVGALASLIKPTVAMEPLALLATQPAWQAGQPVTVNVDYDGETISFVGPFCKSTAILFSSVPAFGTMDEVADLQDVSMTEYKVAKRCKCACHSDDVRALEHSTSGANC